MSERGSAPAAENKIGNNARRKISIQYVTANDGFYAGTGAL